MKRTKVLALVVVIVMLAAVFAACSTPAAEAPASEAPASEAPASEAPAEEPATEAPATEAPAEEPAGEASGAYNFVYLSPNHANPFWQMVAAGVEETAAAMGSKVTISDAQDDPAKQISQAEDALLNNPDVVFLSPFETDTGTAITELCNAANVPIFILDTGSEADYTCFITSDNKQGGRVAGDFLLANTDDSRNVAELQGLIGRVVPAQRGVGFNEVMSENDVEVKYVQPADFNREKGMSLMENFLTTDPEINAVFCWNDEMALGAKEAIAARGLTDKILLVGFDATDEAVQAVIDGQMAATVAQNPYGFGQQGVELAYKFLAGEEIEKDVLIECKVIDASNAQAYLDGTL